MSGTNPRMNPLESRKQCLIAESELNRAQMVDDMAVLTAGVRTLAVRARAFGSLSSSAAVLVAGLMTLRRGRPVNNGAKSSWLQTILKGTGLISTLWLAFRAKTHDQEKGSRDHNRSSSAHGGNHKTQNLDYDEP